MSTQSESAHSLVEIGPVTLPFTTEEGVESGRSGTIGASRGFTNASIAIAQGVEPAFWDEVHDLALRPARLDSHSKEVSIPKVIGFLREEQTISRTSIDQTLKRTKRIQETLSLTRNQTREWLEICMAMAKVREGITLRIFPKGIVEDFTEETRELFLTQELASHIYPHEATPTALQDGLLISSSAGRSPFHPEEWTDTPELLAKIHHALSTRHLIKDEELNIMQGLSAALNRKMPVLHRAWVTAPETLPPMGRWKNFLVASGWMGKPTPPELKVDVETRARKNFLDIVTPWIEKLHQGFRRERFARLMR